MASPPPPAPQDDDDDEELDAFHATSFQGTQYELLKRLGKGGMGVVFQARHRATGEICALKTLHRQFARDRELVSRLRLEAKILRELKHPNVVVILDAGVTPDGLAFYVMELLAGMTLREVSRALQGRLSLRWVLTIVLELLDGLQAAHAIGVLHRDIKPHNIFITEAGTVKLIDFGVAKAVFTVEGKDPTAAGMFLGTFSHTAPETMNGRPATVQSDLYSVGVVLWELIVGKPPFLDDKNVPWTVSDIVTKGVPRLEDVGFGHVPTRLSKAVRRATYVDPTLRYPSVTALADDLREVLARLPAEDAMPARISFPSLPAVPLDAPPLAKSVGKQGSDEGDLTIIDAGLPGRIGVTVRVADASVVPAFGGVFGADDFDQTRREASPFGLLNGLWAEASRTAFPTDEQTPPSDTPAPPASQQAPGSTAHSRPTEPNAHLSSYLAQIDPDGATECSQPAVARQVSTDATKRSALPLLSPTGAAKAPPGTSRDLGGEHQEVEGLSGRPEFPAPFAFVGTLEGEAAREEPVLQQFLVLDAPAQVAAEDGATKRSRVLLVGGSTPVHGAHVHGAVFERIADVMALPTSAPALPLSSGATVEADLGSALVGESNGSQVADEWGAGASAVGGESSMRTAEVPAVDSQAEMQLSSGRSFKLDDESTELRLQDEWDRTATMRGPQRPKAPSSSKRDAAYGPAALGLSDFRQSLAEYRERAKRDGVEADVSVSEDGVVRALVPLPSDAWPTFPAGSANDAGRGEAADAESSVETAAPPAVNGKGSLDPETNEAIAPVVAREPEAGEVQTAAAAQRSMVGAEAVGRDVEEPATSAVAVAGAETGATVEAKESVKAPSSLSEEERALLVRLVKGDERAAVELEGKLLPILWMLNGAERMTAVKVLVRDRVGIHAAPSETDDEEKVVQRAIRERVVAGIDVQCASYDGGVRYAVLRPGLQVRGEVAPPTGPARESEPEESSPPADSWAPSSSEWQRAKGGKHAAQASNEQAARTPVEGATAIDGAEGQTTPRESAAPTEVGPATPPSRPPTAAPSAAHEDAGAPVASKPSRARAPVPHLPPGRFKYVALALAVLGPGLLGIYWGAAVGKRTPAPAASARSGAPPPPLLTSASATPGATTPPSASIERTAPRAPRP